MGIETFRFFRCRRRSAKKNSRSNRGQGLVEFALTLPIVVLLVFGVFETGRMIYVYNAVLTATREAARYGSAGDSDAANPRYKDCAGIRAVAKRLGGLANIQDADILISYDKGPGTATIAATCPPSVEIAGGVDRVVVQVSAKFQPFAALVNFPLMTFQSTVARTIIVKIEVP